MWRVNIEEFLCASPRLLLFGFTIAFFSAFGQTFFIALSGAQIREAFELSHGDFGIIFSIATISSAVFMIWTGALIDRMELRLFTSIVCLGLACSCIGMSIATNSIWLLLVLFGLRFCGQGLMFHISTIAMMRYFGVHRGKAISVAALGFPSSEAILPTIAIATMGLIGWRQMWSGAGILLFVFLIPLLVWLLGGTKERRLVDEEKTRRSSDNIGTDSDRNRAFMLRDSRFYILLPIMIAPGFIGTGLIFHITHLVQSKGWSMALFASSFATYAGAHVLTSLIAGVMVDRLSAQRLIGLDLVPYVAGLFILALFEGEWVAFAYMVLAGVSFGSIGVTRNAIWAEIYGTRHLGAIKSLIASLMILSTALSPAVLGIAIDSGVAMGTIVTVCAFVCAFSVTLVAVFFSKFGNDRR